MIAPDEFKRLTWRAQNAQLRPHLEWVLKALTRPAPTHHIAWALSERTGLDEQFLGRLLLRRFTGHGGYATQDGEEAHAYGKTFRRWRWHPLKTEV